MASILVVDDSAVDRRLVGAILDEESDFQVDYAVDGTDALEQLEHRSPDVVLTDLIMPRTNGLQLVAAARTKYPTIPVILMTSNGNEDIAVEALQVGAASYVSKRSMVQKLIGTIHQVLAVSHKERSQSRLLECMTGSSFHFLFHNDATLIGPLVNYLLDGAERLGLCLDADRTRTGIALEEALINAIHHGNLEVDSDLRETDDHAYSELIISRCSLPPYCDRRVRVEAELDREKAVFFVSDEGPGFDPSAIPDPTDPANIERAAGRGVLLMQTFMDEVTYNDRGNAVTLVKHGDINSVKEAEQ